MNTRLVALVTVSVILVGALYISSTSIAFGRETCRATPRNPADSTCVITNDKNGKVEAVLYCINNKECIVVYSGTTGADTGFGIPSDLRNALDAAIGESQNTTKVPKGDFLNDGGLLKGQDDNTSTSQRIINPEERFCKQGTGPRLGTPCVPCNPGEANCIDQVTGGLLDMPDAATSETEEGDDTNPKDLDGSNNAESGPEANPGSD